MAKVFVLAGREVDVVVTAGADGRGVDSEFLRDAGRALLEGQLDRDQRVLTLPDPRASRETYTRAERVSVATLALVAALALRLVSGDLTRHKVVLLDEAWFLLASHDGRDASFVVTPRAQRDRQRTSGRPDSKLDARPNAVPCVKRLRRDK